MHFTFEIGIPALIAIALLVFFFFFFISFFKNRKAKAETISFNEEAKKPKKEKISDGKCPKCGNKLTESYIDSGIYYNCPECHFKQKM